MARGVHTVTRAIRAAGHPEVELVRGEGYHYYVFDDVAANIYETESVMEMHFTNITHERWIADGIAFAERIKGEHA